MLAWPAERIRSAGPSVGQHGGSDHRADQDAGGAVPAAGFGCKKGAGDMTTERKHRCNLCRETIDDKSGLGVQFCSGHSIKVMSVTQAENHMCLTCLVQLQAIDASKK